WDAVMDINLKTMFFLSQSLGRRAIAAGRPGKIVNIASMLSFQGGIRVASYTASKFAVTGATRTIALEVGQYNIRVNAVHPGNTATPLLKALPAEKFKVYEDMTKSQPIPRLGRPEEIAGAVLFFASDDSSYCTGASLLVDGGKLAGIN
ncbi:MAG: SDR family oxidoreductase, partial [Sphingomonadales bacterium]